MAEIINEVNGLLIGPNCIGLRNKFYTALFTSPIPEFVEHGCDLITASGAFAGFTVEEGLAQGMKFSNIFTIGNSIQLGVEDIIEFLDVNYNSKTCATVKLLNLEEIKKNQKRF